MESMSLETVVGILSDCYDQLVPGTIRHADQLLEETETDLRSGRSIKIFNGKCFPWAPETCASRLYPSDGIGYFVDEHGNPKLVITRERYNVVLKEKRFYLLADIDFERYCLSEQALKGAIIDNGTRVIELSKLRLEYATLYSDEVNSDEGYLSINTENGEVAHHGEKPNEEESKLLDRAGFTPERIELLHANGVKKLKISVFSPRYVKEQAEYGHPLAYLSTLELKNFEGKKDILIYNLCARGEDIERPGCGMRGVRDESPEGKHRTAGVYWYLRTHIGRLNAI